MKPSLMEFLIKMWFYIQNIKSQKQNTEYHYHTIPVTTDMIYIRHSRYNWYGIVIPYPLQLICNYGIAIPYQLQLIWNIYTLPVTTDMLSYRECCSHTKHMISIPYHTSCNWYGISISIPYQLQLKWNIRTIPVTTYME